MILNELKHALEQTEDRQALINEVRTLLHELSDQRDQPIDFVRWVPMEKVVANDYNPNSVAKTEMRLLFVSIDADGYTQPIVTVYDEPNDQFIVVDGFHRYSIMVLNPTIRERCHGMLPVVVIDKDINDRMASTVRHNRARGKHSVMGMSSMVFEMLNNGWADEDICNELGMEAEELLRLKHVTGFSKLFKDAEYNRSWMTKNQILLKKKHDEQSQQPG